MIYMIRTLNSTVKFDVKLSIKRSLDSVLIDVTYRVVI